MAATIKGGHLRELRLILLFLVALVGCNKKNIPGAETPEDWVTSVNSKVSQDAIHTLVGQTALYEASLALAKGRRTKKITTNQSLTDLTNSGRGSLAENQDELTVKSARVLSAINTLACHTLITRNNNAGTTGGLASEFSPVELKISGGKCPVEITFKTTLTGRNAESPCA